ncbi:hypothetical protein LCGC14_1678870 [marine sediment metagenome]|uniref:Uncharacterized protein n=1 Tax=marine sediment metagenome TaxID=412755 RepID=A0A0F9HPA9_9ZZZZ
MFFSEMDNKLYNTALKELETMKGVRIVRVCNPGCKAEVQDTHYNRLSEIVVEFDTVKKKGIAGLLGKRQPVIGLEDIRKRLNELFDAEPFVHSNVMLQYNSLGGDLKKGEYPVAVCITTRPWFTQVPSDQRPIQPF